MYKIFLLVFLTACHLPHFPKEKAHSQLSQQFSEVQLMDYYDYPNCSTAHSYATAWKAKDKNGQNISGVLCCDRRFDCIIFKQEPWNGELKSPTCK